MTSKKIKVSYVVILSLLMTGCEFMGPKPHKKLSLSQEQINEKEQSEVIYQELSNETVDVTEKDSAKNELYPGTGQFVSGATGRRPGKVTGKGEYSLNFDDADLGEVAKVILSDILAENYVLSPKVAGKVTLQTSLPLSQAELLPTLEMLLQLNSAALIYQDGLYQIVPATEAASGSFLTGSNRSSQKISGGHQVRVVPVKNVAVEELAEIIKPLMLENTILHMDSRRNIMLITGTAGELNRAMELVNTFDVDMMKGRSFALFPLHNVDALQIIKELERVFNGENDKSGNGLFQFMEIERLNSILVIVHQPKQLKEVERWVYRLDRANTSAGGGVTVYRVQHVDALELAATLNEIFSQATRQSDPASVAAGRSSVTVSNKRKRDNKENGTDSGKSGNSASTAYVAKAPGTLSLADIGDVNIIADETNNALIIVATAQEYAVIQRVIKQLDVMPLQVLIDATIIEVTLLDELKYGIKWFLSHKDIGGKGAASSGGFDLAETASDLAVGAATGGFGYAFISNSDDIKAVLDSSATDNNANIISAPSLMVLNNHEATIQVGREVPVLTSESTNTSGGADPVVTNTIQMRETGITLIVTPRVNANGLVIMDIDQKADDVIPQESGGIRSPSFQQRQIQSTVAVHSGETIVLGGLISENDSFNKTGIPLLHAIPLIGPLFGSTTKSNNKTELVVLITPRVVRTRHDARLITNEFKRKLSGIYELNDMMVEEE